MFFNNTATTEIYTLSLHDALPICQANDFAHAVKYWLREFPALVQNRSEEHTSELQSLRHLVCRLLLEKKMYATLFRCRPLQCPLFPAARAAPQAVTIEEEHLHAITSGMCKQKQMAALRIFLKPADPTDIYPFPPQPPFRC